MNLNLFKNVKFKIFLTVFLVYLFYIAPDYITSNTNRYIILTKAMVDDGTFIVDKYYELTRDWGFYNGHHYIGAAPGLSFMAAPIYMALKPLLKILSAPIELNTIHLFFTFFLAILPGTFLAVILYNMLGRFELKERERLLVVFGSSFGTILFFYSTRFMAPAIGAFFLFCAFYLAFKSKDWGEKKYVSFLAGALLGAAILVDAFLAIGAILVVIYHLSNFKRGRFLNYTVFMAGLAVMAAVHMYYHYTCYGNAFTTASAHSRMHPSNPFSLPKPRILFELTFGTFRGLFMYMPITLVALYGIFAFFVNPEKKFIKEMLIISVFFVSVLLLISGLSIWDGGGDFGPRYFTCFLPFLMIPIAFALKRISYKIVFFITAISIFINWCGVQYGDADNAFTDAGLFALMGLDSNLARLLYRLANMHIRKFNVVTHFSPLIPFVVLIAVICFIWKDELREAAWIKRLL